MEFRFLTPEPTPPPIQEVVLSDAEAAKLEEKYEKEIHELISIMRPDDMSVEEYEEIVRTELSDDVKKVQVTRGKLATSQLEMLKESKEMLVSRISAAVKEARNHEKISSMDPQFVRRSRLALLMAGDTSDFKFYTSTDPQKADIETIRDFLQRGFNNSVMPLQERELDVLARNGFADKYLFSSVSKFSESVDKAPESLLMTARPHAGTETYYNLKEILEKKFSDTPYSKECYEYLAVQRDFNALTFDNFERFEGVDFTDAVITYSPGYPYHAGDMIGKTKRQQLDPEEHERRIEAIVRHNMITDREWGDEELKKRYPESIRLSQKTRGGDKYNEETRQWETATLESMLPAARQLIEQGHMGFVSSTECMRHLAKEEYPWLLEQAKKFDQEHFLAAQNLMRPEDELAYARKLIDSGKSYMLISMVAHPDREVISRGVLNQEIYDELSKLPNREPIPVRAFQGLDSKTFDMLFAKSQPKLQELESFTFGDDEKYAPYRTLQQLISFIDGLFGKGKGYELQYVFGLTVEKVKGKDLEQLKSEIKRKHDAVLDVLPSIYPGTEPELRARMFVERNTWMFELSAEEITLLAPHLPYVTGHVYGGKELSIEALRVLATCKTPEEQKAFSEGLVKIKNVFGIAQVAWHYVALMRDGSSTEEMAAVYPQLSSFAEKYKKFSDEDREFWNKVFPWAESLEHLYNIQKPSVRKEYDPWEKQLIPLVQAAGKDKTLSLTSREDGKIVAEFVERFGMKNLPNMLSLFAGIKRLKTAADMPAETREILRRDFGVDADALIASDPKNIGRILTELEKGIPGWVRSFREEDAPRVIAAIESPYVLEIISAQVGASGHGHDGTLQESLVAYKAALNESPKKFKVPEGYKRFTIEAPERVIADKDQEAEILKEKEKILTNRELNLQMSEYDGVFGSGEIIPGQVPARLHRLLPAMENYLNLAAVGIKEAIQAEEAKTPPNKKALIGLRIRKEQADRRLELFEAKKVLFANSDRMSGQLLEELHAAIPDEWPGKKNLFMELSFADMSARMPEGYQVLTQGLSGLAVSARMERYEEFLGNHVLEHYLNKKHGQDNAIETNDKGLIKILKKYWGVKDFDTSLMKVSTERMKVLSRGEISTKIRSITCIPSKGMQRIVSGDLGKACTSKQNMRFAKGDFENIVSYSLVLDIDTPNERFAGSFLTIETSTDDKNAAMVLRANNPEQNIFNMVDGNFVIESIISEVKRVALARKIRTVVVPLKGGSTSNRSEVEAYYKEKFGQNTPVGLVNNEETNFNGYNIWNKEEDNRVVKI